MENENNENLDSQNENKDVIAIDENDDINAVKEKFGKLSERNQKTTDNNKQLFERAKKAEGFEKDGSGQWIKNEKKEIKIEKKDKPEAKSDEEFGLLELTFLKGEDIKSEEEIAFVKKELEEAGLSKENLPKLLSNKYFKAQLEEFKTEKANIKATSGVEGGGGDSKAVNTPEYWISKGVPPTKEQVPDRKTRAKIARAMIASSKSTKTFYND